MGRYTLTPGVSLSVASQTTMVITLLGTTLLNIAHFIHLLLALPPLTHRLPGKLLESFPVIAGEPKAQGEFRQTASILQRITLFPLLNDQLEGGQLRRLWLLGCTNVQKNVCFVCYKSWYMMRRH